MKLKFIYTYDYKMKINYFDFVDACVKDAMKRHPVKPCFATWRSDINHFSQSIELRVEVQSYYD